MKKIQKIALVKWHAIVYWWENYAACGDILTSNGLECWSNGVEPNRSWFVDTFPLRRGTVAFGGGATENGTNNIALLTIEFASKQIKTNQNKSNALTQWCCFWCSVDEIAIHRTVHHRIGVHGEQLLANWRFWWFKSKEWLRWTLFGGENVIFVRTWIEITIRIRIQQ